jgi:hypothetical protein
MYIYKYIYIYSINIFIYFFMLYLGCTDSSVNSEAITNEWPVD